MITGIKVRRAKSDEYEQLGKLMIEVYSSLNDFPTQDEQPDYYMMLANIGHFAEQEGTQVLVATSADDRIVGGVIYFGDMSKYGSGGTATAETTASGIRLLAVDPRSRGGGVGKALTSACIQLAKSQGHSQVILHTTQAMQVAWGLYQKLGFEPSIDLDFVQGKLAVFGFRLRLQEE